MSRALLLSVRPKWCALMMNGDKTIEVRKGTALYKAIQKLIDEYGYADIYVYCTKDSKDILIKLVSLFGSAIKWDIDLKKNQYAYKTNYNGKVVFKFRCYKVEEILPRVYSVCTYPYTDTLDDYDLLNKSCLLTNELESYLGGNMGYAIHISDLEIFDRPKELSEFRKVMSEYKHWLLCADCSRYWEDESGTPIEPRCELNWKDCDKDRLTKAPQSWCYCEGE